MVLSGYGVGVGWGVGIRVGRGGGGLAPKRARIPRQIRILRLKAIFLTIAHCITGWDRCLLNLKTG